MRNPHPGTSHRLAGEAPRACPKCRGVIQKTEIIPVWSPGDETGSSHADTGVLYTFECGWRAYRVLPGKETLTPFGLAELAR
jgi:hypothetical protein